MYIHVTMFDIMTYSQNLSTEYTTLMEDRLQDWFQRLYP